MKRITISLFVLFTLAALAPLVNAQCFENSELGRILAGPCTERLVRRAYAPVDYYLNNPVGYGNPNGIGGGRVARDIGAGLLGASVGGAFGGRKGAIIGGTAGVGAAELIGHFASRRGGNAAADPSAGGGSGDFELSNSTRYSVDVYLRKQKKGEEHLGRLASGDVWAVKAPKPGEAYHGYVLIPNNSGGLSSDHLYPAPNTNGWEFVEPPEAVVQGGGR